MSLFREEKMDSHSLKIKLWVFSYQTFGGDLKEFNHALKVYH